MSSGGAHAATRAASIPGLPVLPSWSAIIHRASPGSSSVGREAPAKARTGSPKAASKRSHAVTNSGTPASSTWDGEAGLALLERVELQH